MLNLLRDGWHERLTEVVSSATQELIIVSPFITHDGADFVLTNLNPEFRTAGRLEIVTNLATLNMVQGSTDPEAVLTFYQKHQLVTIYHLPRLHAKVYASDHGGAIVTSGNLTGGGLYQNLEYGVHIVDDDTVSQVRADILEYAGLGAVVRADQLASYCVAAGEAKAAFKEHQNSAAHDAKRRFSEALTAANDELIRLRLGGESTHAIFAKTILYLLHKHGPLATSDLHVLVQQLHSDLCDDAVDRIIDGRHFGKRWKHTVRSAQQTLKQAGEIEITEDGFWRIRGD